MLHMLIRYLHAEVFACCSINCTLKECMYMFYFSGWQDNNSSLCLTYAIHVERASEKRIGLSECVNSMAVSSRQHGSCSCCQPLVDGLLFAGFCISAEEHQLKPDVFKKVFSVKTRIIIRANLVFKPKSASPGTTKVCNSSVNCCTSDCQEAQPKVT